MNTRFLTRDKRTFHIREGIFVFAALACLTPWVTPPVALLLGLGIAFFVGHPFIQLNHRMTNLLLQVSVVGLGFGIDADTALKAGREGVLFSVASIAGTLLFGLLLGRWMKIEKKTSLLISGGTAICGGSAIAALAPVIGAEEKQVSVALGTIFILNSVALFLFPFVGRLLHLSQLQFGLWSAIAIHDTSSVVGAAGKYGPEALAIATTVKLVRALWIVPVSLLAAFFLPRRRVRIAGIAGNDGLPIKEEASAGVTSRSRKARIPWFIGFFILAILFNSWRPLPRLDHAIVNISHAGLALTLFLIGAGLTPHALKGAGLRTFAQGVILWALITVGALAAVLSFVS
ncbi:MAG TPA: putative sulfate exporter family transporter [Puia sp.]|nr:putative sulfate exporter family transporter [Puia sp.]